MSEASTTAGSGSPADAPGPGAEAVPGPARSVAERAAALRLLPVPAGASVSDPLPATPGRAVLVLDADPRAAALLSGRLTERGFACVVSGPEGVRAALATGRCGAAVVGVPSPEARSSSLARTLAPFAGWGGALVLVSSAPLRADLPDLRIAGAFVRPYFMDDLLAVLAAAGLAPGAPEPVLSPSSAASPSPTASPSSPHEDDAGSSPRVLQLDLVQVRGSLHHRSEAQSRVRVRSIDPSGGMAVEGRQLLPASALVTVELEADGAAPLRLRGRVAAATTSRMDVAFELAEGDAARLAAFAVASQDPAAPSPARVVLREVDADGATPLLDEAGILALWREVAGSLDDAEAHQRFIQVCVKAHRLELAVQCYRELKRRSPEDERVARYLNQVGTILGFYALRKQTAPGMDEERKLPRSVKLGLVFLGLLLAALGLAALLLGGRGAA